MLLLLNEVLAPPVVVSNEPVTLKMAKAAARIDTDDEDFILAMYLRAAIARIERVTGKKLAPTSVTQVADGFPGGARYLFSAHAGRDAPLRLWYGPVSAISTVEYDDPDGATQTLSSFRLVEGAGGSAKLLPAYGECWPVTACGPGTVRISYVAGYDPSEVPQELLQAVLLLFGHFYAYREAVNSGPTAAAVELPLGVEDLISPYCAPGIG